MHAQSLAHLTHVKLNKRKVYVLFEGQRMRQATKEANGPRRTKSRRSRPAKTPKPPKHFSSVTNRPKSRFPGAKRGILFCPKCGSTNLFWASGLPHLWSIWECRNCGYRGAFIVRDGELAEKVRENYAKRTVRH
jgi:predicted RNA-binding Zn-ribbon protein involved in translation (DUF1610 family)